MYLRENSEELASPKDLLDSMRLHHPKLYQFFRPPVSQLAFFLISNCRKGDLSAHGALLTTLVQATQKKPVIEVDGLRKRDLKKKVQVVVETAADEEVEEDDEVEVHVVGP